ncbi:hypothetical protein JVT61DRAFT_5864 [Boletus reticuloceps]|uniref:KOW domain-containing protein n=1 Tax=Boletus reticuloceps TaxID=495285 RepID=A0A8I2YL77_9AGAM|nr:hypothetical protein JVT61DRAFT_5864 [Boletus reticuloceps]
MVIRPMSSWCRASVPTTAPAGLDLTVIVNSMEITAFQRGNFSYSAGLLRLPLKLEHLEWVVLPDMEELFFFHQAGVDPSLVEESHVLFSSQFWIKGDAVRSSSPQILGKIARVMSVQFDQQTVLLLLDDQMHDCSILEQRRVFSSGDHVRVIAGANRGFVGAVIGVLEANVVLTSSTDLTHEGMKKVRYNEVQLDVLFQHGFFATVPITSCQKLADFSMREASKLVGKEVWVVGGEFKGRPATLDHVGPDESRIYLNGYPALNVPNRHIASSSGVLLTGRMLDQTPLQQLVDLIRRLYKPQIARPREKTPPPSPQASSSALPEAEGSPWVVTASDVPTPTRPEDLRAWLVVKRWAADALLAFLEQGVP